MFTESATRIDADFPGGNIVLDGIAGDIIRVHQDLRDTKGDWFWFYFRVRGAAGRTLKVEFTGSGVLGPLGPAVSFDDGATWSWLGPESMQGHSVFSCTLPPQAEAARFAFAMPYTTSNLDAFLERHASNSELRVEKLCATRKGRPLRVLRMGRANAEHLIALTCRHHACEASGSFSLEGFIDAVLGADPIARRLAQTEIVIVPIVDLDGVEDGDQGKNRIPYDHNHDYGDPQIYPETRAVRKLLSEYSGRLRVVLDLHCPWIRGDQNCHVFFSGARNTWDEVLRFGKICNESATSPLCIDPRFHVAYGEKWNLGNSPLLLKHWASELPGVRLSTALEIPYAVAGRAVVLPETARAFGRDVAAGLVNYLGL